MDIQLVIRAPNQNIDDQVISCSGEWTIHRLKTHLSEVYPNRPIVQDQKLIYSGHLLQDGLKLKDVVRPDDAESNVHIFHLVCNAKYPAVQTSGKVIPHEQSTANSSGFVYPTEPNLQPTTHAYSPEMNYSQMTPYAFPALYNDPQLVAQMAAMQQMYTQYMIQYWQSFIPALNGNPPVIPVMPNFRAAQSADNSGIQDPPQQQVNQRRNAVDDDFDWFDMILHHCRFLVLLSVMYFYSSPERFIIVLFLVVFTILYREGWLFRPAIEDAVMRIRNWTPNEVVDAPVNNVNEEVQPNNEEAGNAQELEAAMDGENPPHTQNPDVINNNQRNSFFSIIAAFFFSLVPEAPPPVNIN